jgi:hypothetical protein
MVTATICRSCENSATIDPTVAEILAHQAHPAPQTARQSLLERQFLPPSPITK